MTLMFLNSWSARRPWLLMSYSSRRLSCSSTISWNWASRWPLAHSPSLGIAQHLWDMACLVMHRHGRDGTPIHQLAVEMLTSGGIVSPLVILWDGMQSI